MRAPKKEAILQSLNRTYEELKPVFAVSWGVKRAIV